MVCELTTDVAIVESFVTDAQTWRDHQGDLPTLEFYETDELGNQLDNWFGPSVSALVGMCRAAGFARVELMHAGGFTAGVACFRHWEPENPSEAPPNLTAVMNNRTLGINFSMKKEEYLSCWFNAAREPARDELRLEIGPYGVPALHVRPEAAGGWLANFRIPPGLTPGWHDVKLRFATSGFGQSFRIAVDMPPAVEKLSITTACDGQTWAPEIKAGGYVSCWVEGLPENADRANTIVRLNERKARVEYVGKGQINAEIPKDIEGRVEVTVECGGIRSEKYLLMATNTHE